MESATINNNINVIKEVRKLFNAVRSNLSDEEKKKAVYSALKEKEQKGSLTSRQKNTLINDERYLKNISIHLNAMQEVRKLFNECRSSLFHKKIKKN